MLSEKVRARARRPPKDEVRLVPLTDASFVRQMESWMVHHRPPAGAVMAGHVDGDNAQLAETGGEVAGS